MGIMAFHAVALDHDPVGADCLFRYNRGVAGAAYVLRVTGKHFPVR